MKINSTPVILSVANPYNRFIISIVFKIVYKFNCRYITVGIFPQIISYISCSRIFAVNLHDLTDFFLLVPIVSSENRGRF